MKDWPQPFWAIIIAAMGFALALAVLHSPSSDAVRTAVLVAANSLISGALGAFAGAAHTQANTTATGPNTVINAPNPISPVDPAQPK